MTDTWPKIEPLSGGVEIITHKDGTKEWYRNGQLYRDDGPAVEDAADGSKVWYRNDQLHRDDGPAIERPDGTKEWWVDGKHLTPEAFERHQADVRRQREEKEAADKIAADEAFDRLWKEVVEEVSKRPIKLIHAKLTPRIKRSPGPSV